MPNNSLIENLSHKRIIGFTFVTLLLSLVLIYGNSFDCEWHMDDISNILKNKNIHIQSISWENIKNTFYGKDKTHNNISRPISFLTFALNYYYGGTKVFGYHLVNFIIHFLSSVFLFLFILYTLRLPVIKERYNDDAYSIALLSVFFWATHPIQVPAITYIVQRMTSMTGMFYIMSMFFYLRARTVTGKNRQVFYFIICIITGISSFFCKENAAMLPASIFLYDIFLIQGVSVQNVKKSMKYIIIPFIIILMLSVYYADFTSIFNEYKFRPFSLIERLLTEPRVVLFYISLLLYPVSSRFTLLHDFDISTSIYTPWTTFAGISVILAIILMAILLVRKRPLISYCIIFFFLNHIIEGSVVALELVFEHRNYLPSMMFFIPFSILFIRTLNHFSYIMPIKFILASLIIFLLISQAHTTFYQNSVYRDDISLWTDNVRKAENLHRPRHNLAKALLKRGYFEEGFSEMQTSLNAKAGGRIFQKNITYYNLGISYLYLKEYDKALECFIKLLEYIPNKPLIYQMIATTLIKKKSYGLAEEYIKKAINLSPDSKEPHKILEIIILKKKISDKN